MALLSFADSTPRAYRLKVRNASFPNSTETGAIPMDQERVCLPMAVSPPATVTCRLLQNSYTAEAQFYQNVTVKARPKPPIKQCKFTEEQVYEAMLKHEGARSSFH
jgi:hypothetical protein